MVDLGGAGRIVSAAAEAVGDALRVHQLGLTLRDPTAARSHARLAAVEAAHVQAEELASVSGTEVGRPLAIVEPGGWERRTWRCAVPTCPPIERGALEVAVTVTYALVL